MPAAPWEASPKPAPYPDAPARAAGCRGSRSLCFLTQHSGRKDTIVRGARGGGPLTVWPAIWRFRLVLFKLILVLHIFIKWWLKDYRAGQSHLRCRPARSTPCQGLVWGKLTQQCKSVRAQGHVLRSGRRGAGLRPGHARRCCRGYGVGPLLPERSSQGPFCQRGSSRSAI